MNSRSWVVLGSKHRYINARVVGQREERVADALRDVHAAPVRRRRSRSAAHAPERRRSVADVDDEVEARAARGSRRTSPAPAGRRRSGCHAATSRRARRRCWTCATVSGVADGGRRTSPSPVHLHEQPAVVGVPGGLGDPGAGHLRLGELHAAGCDSMEVGSTRRARSAGARPRCSTSTASRSPNAVTWTTRRPRPRSSTCSGCSRPSRGTSRGWTSRARRSSACANAPRDRAAWIKVLAENPVLVQRPIVLTADGRAVIGRPPEKVLDLLGGG